MNICVYLPKREELSLRTVLAFPNDSNRGVASSICGQSQHRNVSFNYDTEWNGIKIYKRTVLTSIWREKTGEEKES